MIFPPDDAAARPFDDQKLHLDGKLDLTRRTVLVGADAGGGALLLAACSASSGGDDATATTSAATTSAAGTTSASATTVVPTTEPTTAATTAAPPVTGRTIAALSAVPVGGGILTNDKDGQPIIVAQPTAGTAVAFSAICTHQQCTVNAPVGDSITCPCHGSMSQTRTGQVTRSPQKAWPSVAVTVADGTVIQT